MRLAGRLRAGQRSHDDAKPRSGRHFRHEVGHYYWDKLVRDGNKLQQFRALFGDETADYAAALQRHYAQGPPANWADSYISSYATVHPWEDFAETWAHYIHIVDSLETAAAYGLSITAPPVGSAGAGVAIQFDPYHAAEATDLIAAWGPLTVMLNSINRSMGLRDFYPFVMSGPVMTKLSFIHNLVQGKLPADAPPPN